MTDHHIHIGQFNQVYYDAIEVFETIESTQSQTGITEVLYSSTSSCRDDVTLDKVEEEINYAQSFMSQNLSVCPYLWFVPKYAEENISVQSATRTFDYCGIKIHPFAQKWDMENPIHKKAMEQIFQWSEENQKFILIHCGPNPETFPNRFEDFFKTYPKSKPILAHSNPVYKTVDMLKKYPNVFCDTAYISKKNLLKLFDLTKDCPDCQNRILFGTDFPVTHYFEGNLFNRQKTLAQEYILNCQTQTDFLIFSLSTSNFFPIFKL